MGSKGSEEKARVREEQAWALRESGLTLRGIAARLNVSHITIRKDLARVESRIAEDVNGIALRVLARDLAQLEYVQSQAMEAWERSKARGKRVRRRQVEGQPAETCLDVVERDGDARFLTAALSAIESRRNMLERFDLAKRLDEVERQLGLIPGGPATPPRPDGDGRRRKSPYHHADPAPAPATPPAEAASLFDPDFIRDLGDATTDDTDRRQSGDLEGQDPDDDRGA